MIKYYPLFLAEHKDESPSDPKPGSPGHSQPDDIEESAPVTEPSDHASEVGSTQQQPEADATVSMPESDVPPPEVNPETDESTLNDTDLAVPVC
jgi:hypothetical protein